MTIDEISSLFTRVKDVDALSPDDFLDRLQRCGFFWFHGEKAQKLPRAQTILEFLRQNSSACETSWTVENRGDCGSDAQLTPSSLTKITDQSFYVSTIIHRKDESAFDSLTQLLPDYAIFQDLHFTSEGAWVFVGNSGVASGNNKRKRSNMVGRAEHVDEVAHSGTYHTQIAGSKTWWIRPHPELYCGEPLPDLSTIPGAEQFESTKSWRLKIEVEQGDVLVLNTKIWYHYTELPPPEWSISIAHDFYLPIPCPQDAAEGDVVLGEDDIPDEIPRTNDPNCALAEVEGDDEEEDLKIVLVALKDIREGDLLSIAHDEEGGDLCNANETVDPRAIAKRDFEKGQIVLEGDDIPTELPRSLEPNCEISDDGEITQLRATVVIAEGEVFCIIPNEEDEYEEVEVDLATGELKR